MIFFCHALVPLDGHFKLAVDFPPPTIVRLGNAMRLNGLQAK